LMNDPHVLGRIDAAQALSRLASPSAVQTLGQALLKERFWGTQAEIARALGRTLMEPARELLLGALRQVEHPKVGRAIYEGLGHFRHPEVEAELRDRYAGEASYFVEGEAIRSLGRMRERSHLEVFKESLKRDSWNDILRCAALEAIAALHVPESIE